MGALALPVSKALKLVNTGVVADLRSSELRRVWEEHRRTDTYPNLDEARRACRENPPGARVRRHLLRRNCAVWSKPVR